MRELKWQGAKGNRAKQSHTTKMRGIQNFLQAQINFGKLNKTHSENDLVHSLRNGDEKAFNILIDRYHSSLMRLAMAFVPDQAVAEEVVQETWMGVLQGIEQFEGRSSLKTWIFRILTNRSKTRGTREKRYVAFADIVNQRTEEEIWSNNTDDHNIFGIGDNQRCFNLRDHVHMSPEKDLLSKECLTKIANAIEALPSIQQQVIILSDVEGSPGADICEMLNISENNRRIILHRARCKVRKVMGKYLEEDKCKAVPNRVKPLESLGFYDVDTALS